MEALPIEITSTSETRLLFDFSSNSTPGTDSDEPSSAANFESLAFVSAGMLVLVFHGGVWSRARVKRVAHPKNLRSGGVSMGTLWYEVRKDNGVWGGNFVLQFRDFHRVRFFAA